MFSLNLRAREYPIKKKLYDEAKRNTFLRVGQEWHERFLPKHFTHEGATEYGYYKRKGELQSGASFGRSYTGRKFKKFGHTLPLVWSGTGRNLAKIQIIRVTANWGKVVLPSVFNWKHPKSQIVMREEITRITQQEQDHLIRLADDEMGRQFKVLGT